MKINIPTESESYQDGYKTGVTWKNCWIPGGPSQSIAHSYDKPEWKAYCEQSRRNNVAWRKGWQDEVSKQHEAN